MHHYRPGNVHGFPGEALALGVAHYSALAVYQGRDAALKAREDALVSAAEAETDSAKALKLLEKSAAERKAIGEERLELSRQMAAETARRDLERAAPAALSEEELAARLLDGDQSPHDQALARLQLSGPIAGRHYAQLFGKPQAAAAQGWTGFDDFLATIHTGRSDPRVVAATSMGTVVGSDGGFLVPEQYTAELLDSSLEDEVVRPLARIYPITQGNTRKVAGFDGRDQNTGIYGLRGVWLEESGTATPQKAKTRLFELIAHKLGIYTQASNELVADGMTFEELLGLAMREAIGFDLDTAFLTGNGVAKPLGIMNDPATITVAKETGQGADTILYDNLKKMFARMYSPGRRRAVWVVNSTAIPELLSLSQAVGTGGVAVPVMTEGGDGTFRILTRPVIFTDKLPAVGDRGDINFVDFSQYAIGMRKEAVLDKSNGPGWFEDETSYRTILRVDGRGRWAAPLAPKVGATQSWSINLADRA